jgi:hypothetical protein
VAPTSCLVFLLLDGRSAEATIHRALLWSHPAGPSLASSRAADRAAVLGGDLTGRRGIARGTQGERGTQGDQPELGLFPGETVQVDPARRP